MAAPNERFGVRRGVRSRTFLWDFGSLSPVAPLVPPATSSSGQHDIAILADNAARQWSD